MLKRVSFLVLSLVLALDARAQIQTTEVLKGTWKATFADSVFSGTVFFSLDTDAAGNVTGTYRATTGGFGKVSGVLSGQVFRFKLTQTIEGCPGFYEGSLTLERERGAGTYIGSDCQGEHKNGIVSMVRATAGEITAINSPEILPGGATSVPWKQILPSLTIEEELVKSFGEPNSVVIPWETYSSVRYTFNRDKKDVTGLEESKYLRVGMELMWSFLNVTLQYSPLSKNITLAQRGPLGVADEVQVAMQLGKVQEVSWNYNGKFQPRLTEKSVLDRIGQGFEVFDKGGVKILEKRVQGGVLTFFLGANTLVVLSKEGYSNRTVRDGQFP